MENKRKAYEEKLDAQLDEWKAQHHGIKIQMNKTNGYVANSHARSLAEAIIAQSIEDLWDPVCRKGSLIFFEGAGFVLCSEIAGISYIKRLAMLRMLAHANPIIDLRNMRKAL
ncbi:MAG: hypothetical protein IBX72_15635 [Nitrospirae bacterium]|jgi:hypothetical protein|nr:hypothetical protein [Nitrospirota bacterium]